MAKKAKTLSNVEKARASNKSQALLKFYYIIGQLCESISIFDSLVNEKPAKVVASELCKHPSLTRIPRLINLSADYIVIAAFEEVKLPKTKEVNIVGLQKKSGNIDYAYFFINIIRKIFKDTSIANYQNTMNNLARLNLLYELIEKEYNLKIVRIFEGVQKAKMD